MPQPERSNSGLSVCQPQFEEGGTPAELILLCPVCGHNYLHHVQVEVYSRKEDAKTGLRVVVSEQVATVGDDASTDNPSTRRGGVRIKFWCEECQGHSTLTLVQHKGQTCLECQFQDEE